MLLPNFPITGKNFIYTLRALKRPERGEFYAGRNKNKIPQLTKDLGPTKRLSLT
jgi:hypothetical protein